MSPVTFTESKTLTFETLCCGVCGVWFALTTEMHAKMRNGDCYHCPNGHSITYRKTEAQQLRERLAETERQLRESKCETLAERHAKEFAERSKVASERKTAASERKLARVNAGVCPCCNRTFQNLSRHMATKHKGQNT